MNLFAMVTVGVLAGIISGIFGVGGGIVIVPILLTIFAMKYHAATGTSLVALLMPVGIFGAYEYYRSGKIGSTEILAGLMIGLGMFVGVYIGANIAVPLPANYLRKAFAILLCLTAIKTWFS